jgi:hypothetical protein
MTAVAVVHAYRSLASIIVSLPTTIATCRPTREVAWLGRAALVKQEIPALRPLESRA